MLVRGAGAGLLALTAALVPVGPRAAQAAGTVTVTTCDEAHLRAAISGAAAGDTVNFGCSGTITLISGGGSVQVFTVSGGVSVALNGPTIADGSGSGGGVYNAGTLRVADSIFSGNGPSSLSGGGGGGAIYNAGTLTVADSTFSGNSVNFGVYSGAGGAIYNAGTLTVADSTFSGNGTSSISGSASGGAIYNAGILSVADSTFSANSALGSGRAGALTGSGGGIYNRGALRVANSTFSANSVGGAFAVAGVGGSIFTGGGAATLANTVLADASGGECSGSMSDAGGNLADDASCAFSLPSSANGSASLAGSLGPLASNGGPTRTIALLPGSPAVGAGLAATCLSTGPTGVNDLDQRGVPRHADARGRCDSGAYDTGGPAEQIGELMGLVESVGLPPGLRASLESKLRDAAAALQAGDPATACGDLTAFGNEVRAQAGKKISQELAQRLLGAAQAGAVLGC